MVKMPFGCINFPKSFLYPIFFYILHIRKQLDLRPLMSNDLYNAHDTNFPSSLDCTQRMLSQSSWSKLMPRLGKWARRTPMTCSALMLDTMFRFKDFYHYG